ncbi:hypothetical protein K432DRAFT_383157 [Lepidopterella palustris CBS 459.81]|uniref:Uncharacterized protein n=1 Tax=Lepidopterella palustris CBS 459.81 TaxID=1314670 RepID=A0A8E2E8G2_9PEZI|nr:hypothetical protein K432DRAFT_383157 [Lepidopterella palustris CBS 459.81]
MESKTQKQPHHMSSSSSHSPEFVCPFCGDSFKRLEHLSRHKLSHSDERPYHCPTCHKAFTRKDTLNRHIPIHSSSGRPDKRSSVSRVSRACCRCARSRLRCDGEAPCGRCTTKNAQCTYPGRSRRRIAVVGPQPVSSGPPSIANSGFTTESTVGTQVKEHREEIPNSQQTLHVHVQSRVTHMAKQNDRLLADYEGLNTLSSAAMDLTTSISVDNRQSPSPIPHEDSMGPPHGHFASTSLASHHIQQTLTERHNGSPAMQNSYDIEPTQSGQAPCQTADRFSPCGRQQSTVTFVDSGVVTNDDTTTISGVFGLGSPWDQAFELTDWMTFDSTFDLGAMPSVPEYAAHISLPLSEDTLRFDQYPTSNLADTTQCQPAEWDRANNEIIPDRRLRLQDTPSSPSDSSAGMNQTAHLFGRQVVIHSLESHVTPSETVRNRNYGAPPAHQWPTDWDPGKSDNVMSFPDMKDIPIEILEAEKFGHVEKMSQDVHDEIARCLKLTSRPESSRFRAFENACLPSIQAMDCFIQLYFEYFHPIFPMLHQPTFNPSKAPWQLVLATAAVGCRYSKAPGSRKAANALQELLRRAIGLTCEQDNSNVREIWLAQAILLNSLGMTYSGDKRLLEIAEACRSFGITLCRRNGCLKHVAEAISIDSVCRGSALEEKWRQWIRDESRRRLGFCCWLVDSQLVLYLDSSPAMGVDEPQQQLPCQEAVWDAPSAEEWKILFLEQQRTGLRYNISATLRNLRLSHLPLPNFGDFARLVLVFAIYRCTVSMHHQNTNPFLPASYRAFDDDAQAEWNVATMAALTTLFPTPAEHTISYESPLKSSLSCHVSLISLLLFIPRKELLTFAHTHGTDQERYTSSARHVLALWMQAQDGQRARQAVIHAGTLFRLLRKHSCQGFHEPITALLVTLVVWAFNQLAPQDHSESVNGTGERGSMVRLDRVLSDEIVRAWIEGKQGLNGHLTDVGNICGLDAGNRLLYVGGAVLRKMDTWALSQGLAVWLAQLRARSATVAMGGMKGAGTASRSTYT